MHSSCPARSLPGAGRLHEMGALFRIAPGDFHLAEKDERITLVRDERGNVDHCLFLKDGKIHRAVRVDAGGREF